MALQALLPYAPAAISGLGALFSKDEDPDEWRRDELRKLLKEIRDQFPQMEAALRTREAVERGGMQRRVSDVGAAGGMPRNVISQNIASVGLGSQRNLNEALAQLDQQKLQTLQSLGGLIGQVPPERESLWPQLLGMSIQDLLGSGGLQNLGGLFQSGGGAPTAAGGISAPGSLQGNRKYQRPYRDIPGFY